MSKRYIRKLHNGSVRSDGTYIRMSNNAEAYFIVE
ncbi:BPSL0067 family protein [Salmonella enterica]